MDKRGWVWLLVAAIVIIILLVILTTTGKSDEDETNSNGTIEGDIQAPIIASTTRSTAMPRPTTLRAMGQSLPMPVNPAAITHLPVNPLGQGPVNPLGQGPVNPLGQGPVNPLGQGPVNPLGQGPVNPLGQGPVNPLGQGPVNPLGQGPVNPLGQGPIDPIGGSVPIPAQPDVIGVAVTQTQNVCPRDFSRPVNTIMLSDAPIAVRDEILAGAEGPEFANIKLPDHFQCGVDKWAMDINTSLDQGACGSCWAFSTASAISDRIRIGFRATGLLREEFVYNPFSESETAYNALNDLSPYELVNCDVCGMLKEQRPQVFNYLAGMDQECDKACQGGFIGHAYHYVATYGLKTIKYTPTSCDPAMQVCPCDSAPGGGKHTNSEFPTDIPFKPKRVYSVINRGDSLERRRQKVMEDVYLHGPVTVSFMVYQSFNTFFTRNPTGVYTQADKSINDQPVGGHAVVIIGWGKDDSTGIFYWVIRNSWGPFWADRGRFRMQFDLDGLMSEVWAAEA